MLSRSRPTLLILSPSNVIVRIFASVEEHFGMAGLSTIFTPKLTRRGIGQPKLKQIANELGMDLFSSPFDASAVEFLEQMEVPACSLFEIVDMALIAKVAQTGKPLIISTGMATAEEVQEALKCRSPCWCDRNRITQVHECVSRVSKRNESANHSRVATPVRCAGGFV